VDLTIDFVFFAAVWALIFYLKIGSNKIVIIREQLSRFKLVWSSENIY